MKASAYWKEAVACSLDEHGIVATDEVIEKVARDMEMAREMQSEATGELNIPNPLITENKILEKRLHDEIAKRGCSECGGRGYITTNFGMRSSTSQCDKCHGEGKVRQ